MDQILIDIGSSTIKAYYQKGEELKSLITKSILFKEGFDPEKGIIDSSKKELFELINSIKDNNRGIPIKIFATGIFRKLSQNAQSLFIDEFLNETGLNFNIISQNIENSYLEMALAGKCTLDEPILLVNIGGGSTELVVMEKQKAIERKNVDLGVGTINTYFPDLNQPISKVELEIITQKVKEILPSLSTNINVAFYTGGELTYMNIAGYNLEKNTLFNDKDHPLFISIENFSNRNKEIFSKITLGELESLMPENPKWMLGARACSAIAQAIFEKYNIKKIIPSDSNLINGVVRSDISAQ